jgi:hypothetical protein
MPSGDTLSPFRSLAQQLAISQSYTANTNLLEVAFSPQDEINEDIMDQIGYFNIGEYIGDPRLRSSSAESYPLLDTLRNEYFQKYTKNYDLVDYIRLIKFFDNSLFKMIKDFVPVRTSFASGIVIKQHLLERNKYPQPQVNNHSTIAYYPSGSSTNPSNNQPLTFQNIIISGTVVPQWNDFQPGTIEDFSGGTGGVFEIFNGVNSSPYGPNGIGPENIFNLTQSWYETIPTISGSVIILHNTQDEFYDGEFSGSNIIVTTQSLAQAYPLDNFVFDYTPVRYSPLLYDLSIDDLAEFTQTQFLNSLTIPDQGEILLLRPYFRLGGFSPSGNPLPNITGPTFVKIHKFDNNGVDNTIPLGQANKLLIQYSTIPSYYTLNILTVNEYSTYYLYEVNTLGSNTADNYILDYKFSGSITEDFNILGNNATVLALTESIDNANVFNPSTSTFTYSNTPNVAIIFSASILGRSSSSISPTFPQLSFSNDPFTFYNSNIPFPISSSSPATVTFSGTIFPLNGSPFTARIANSGFFSVSNIYDVQFQLTQSIAPSAAENDPIIIEPYITLPNFYNSDYNSLINNIDEYRLSTVYQDVDYSTGITTPTNFGLLISGSALKAAVQDSNYTTKRHIIPRYEGSKSTSQNLNFWTPGDVGTYGKTPTVESLKTMVAYCDSISGWPPERMNASAVHVLYLIRQDGTVIIPNTSANSLTEIQGTFMSGEKLLINSKTIGSGEAVQSRNIIRGGTRIEPILYTQYGQAPNALWNTTMSFTDIIPSNVGAVGNYLAEFKKTSNQTSIPVNTETLVTFNSSVYGNSFLNSNGYQVNAATIQDGVNLTFTTKLNIVTTFNIIPGVAATPLPGVDIKVLLYNTTTNTLVNSQLLQNDSNFNVNYTFTVNNASLQSGVYKISIIVYNSFNNNQNAGSLGNPTTTIFASPTFLKVSQYPAYTQPVTSSGVNSIWNWPNSSSYPYVITSSQTTLVNLYGDPNIKMVDISEYVVPELNKSVDQFILDLTQKGLIT